MNKIFVVYILNKKQHKKLQYIVAAELGFDIYCRTIETQLRKIGLRRAKSTKKLGLTDIQKVQRYKIV